MADDYLYYVWLSLVPQIGVRAQKKLLKQMSSPEEIYHASEAELSTIKGLNRVQIHNIMEYKSLEKSKRIVEHCDRCDIQMLSIKDANYTSKAKKDINSPVLLYTKGRIKQNKLEKSVAIVGARRCTQAGKQTTADVALQYVRQGYAIISGMAKGVDSYGQTACIKNGGYTVAVLGNGLDICYPKEHNKLMQAIEESGLLLSEYPPGVRPQKYYFPKRNRIIAQWSDEVVVIAPGIRSGSFITAEYAQKLGKDVKIID